MKRARLILVLHAHLPWIPREHPQREWLFEAITGCYLPLLDLLGRVPAARLTVSVSAPLAHMLGDPELTHDFDAFLAERRAGLAEVRGEAPRAVAHLDATLGAQRGRGGAVLDGLRRAARRGQVELISCNATHGFLPLLAQCPEAVRAQVEIGLWAHAERFGARPKGLWPAECGYCEGLDETYAQAGLRYFFADTHALTRATPRASHLEPNFCPTGVAVLARDPLASEQVWSRRGGYPGDAAYLDYHHKLLGQRVLRVTGREEKAVWEPEAAFARAKEHAAHFVGARRAQAERGAQWLVAPYDAELFGHWWFEGPAFLEEVLRLAAKEMRLAPCTAAEAVRGDGEGECVQPAASSWGKGGQAAVWLDESNAAIWPHLIRASERMLKLARAHAGASGVEERALNQALRELLLAQASDWPFLIEAKTSSGYARERFEDHLWAFRQLAEGVEQGAPEEAFLVERERTHNLFGSLDFRVYGSDSWAVASTSGGRRGSSSRRARG